MAKLSQIAGRRRDASTRLVLMIVCAGVVLASLDLFIVNVALPDIARDFGTDNLADVSWVLNAYAITYAALLVLFGRMAERRARQNGFLLGVAIFTAASAACGLADSLPALVTFRILQAVGAALLTPTSLSLILATTEADRRPGAVRAWTAVGGVAAAIGPVVGGLLVAGSWRWVFLVNVPIGIAALVVGWRRLPHVPGHPVPRPDALGAALVTVGIAALTTGLVKGADWGWGSAPTVGALAVAAATLGLFVLHTLHHRNPLVDPALFRMPAFAGASVAMTLFSMAFGGMLLSVVLWEQGVWGWSALTTGLAIAPGPLMVPVFAFFVAPSHIARFGAGRVAAAGTAIFAAGIAWWALAAGVEPDYVGDMLGGMLVTGVGVGLALPTLMATAAGSLPPQSFATGSAVINMLRQVGLAVGVAVLIATLGTAPGATDQLAAFQAAWWVLAALSLAGGVAALLLIVPRRRAAADSAQPAAAPTR
jgi:EmrB/QacA subfamily drug resistance transporter